MNKNEGMLSEKWIVNFKKNASIMVQSSIIALCVNIWYDHIKDHIETLINYISDEPIRNNIHAYTLVLGEIVFIAVSAITIYVVIVAYHNRRYVIQMNEKSREFRVEATRIQKGTAIRNIVHQLAPFEEYFDRTHTKKEDGSEFVYYTNKEVQTILVTPTPFLAVFKFENGNYVDYTIPVHDLSHQVGSNML